jgi:hypothetical protein
VVDSSVESANPIGETIAFDMSLPRKLFARHESNSFTKFVAGWLEFQHVVDGPIEPAQDIGDAFMCSREVTSSPGARNGADPGTGHALVTARVLADRLDDGAQEALVRGARPGMAMRQGAALPLDREPEHVQEHGVELGAFEAVAGRGGNGLVLWAQGNKRAFDSAIISPNADSRSSAKRSKLS